MASTDELIQNIVETMDNAHSQRVCLSEPLQSLQQAMDQIKQSASRSNDKVRRHFEALQEAVSKQLSIRMGELLQEIAAVEDLSLEPLIQCEEMITEALSAAVTVMEDGKNILRNTPEENLDALIKFKDSPNTKNLNILPEVPSLHEVAYISADFPDGLSGQLESLIYVEGRIFGRPPVQVTEIEERPGALLVKWEESTVGELKIISDLRLVFVSLLHRQYGFILKGRVLMTNKHIMQPYGTVAQMDEDVEVGEFCLQFCYGAVSDQEAGSRTFHTAYTGPHTGHLVKHLRQNTTYSFRVSCRPDPNTSWSVWSVPRQAMTTIPHYQWSDCTEGYSTSNENKTGTRVQGLTRVLYSMSQSYTAGHRLSFKVMDTWEKSPVDGLAITVANDDIDTLKRPGAVFLGTDGAVFIDGQEMKTRLPCLARNSLVTMETISLTNGKVRVSVQVEEKELTFDWNTDRQVTLGMIGGMGLMAPDSDTQKFYFAMQFSHEDWKIGVE